MLRLALAVLLAASAAGAGAERQKVAVLEFEMVKGLDLDRAYFSDKVRGAVQDRMPQLFVMTRESTEMLLKQFGKSINDCTGECEVETGRQLGADYVVSGRLTRAGTRTALTLRLHATATGELIKASEAMGKDADAVIDAVEPAVEKLLGPLKGAAKATAEAPRAPADKAVRGFAGKAVRGIWRLLPDGRLEGSGANGDANYVLEVGDLADGSAEFDAEFEPGPITTVGLGLRIQSESPTAMSGYWFNFTNSRTYQLFDCPVANRCTSLIPGWPRASDWKSEPSLGAKVHWKVDLRGGSYEAWAGERRIESGAASAFSHGLVVLGISGAGRVRFSNMTVIRR